MARAPRDGVSSLADASAVTSRSGLNFPVIVKPVRGRGSQGVTLARDLNAMTEAALRLLDEAKFGDTLMIEEYLGGEEITVTIMPPKSLTPTGRIATEHWALRPARRINQKDGVAPYNGDVAVTTNSAAVDSETLLAPSMRAIIAACVEAARLVDARAPIRIDCRVGRDGVFRMFDLNMKPNMTGPGRPGRDHQDCLSTIRARAEGWTFAQLLESMLAAAWREA